MDLEERLGHLTSQDLRTIVLGLREVSMNKVPEELYGRVYQMMVHAEGLLRDRKLNQTVEAS